MQHLIINNTKVPFCTGETIVEAAQKVGIHIPTLCWLPKTGHGSVCRICSVEIKGVIGRYAPACTTHAEEGMEVITNSPEIRQLRKSILSMLISDGRHDCFLRDTPKESWGAYQKAAMDLPLREHPCPQDGKCTLKELVEEYDVDVANLVPQDGKFPLDNGFPMITRDFSRCIQCGRCNSACNVIQVNGAIAPQYGRKSEKKHWWPIADYDKCTHCGECLQYCPTGALSAKKAYGLYTKDDDIEHIRTTCPYCGVGCQQELLVKDGRIVEVLGVEDAEPNQGSLCVKGRFGYDFIYSEDRLTDPLIRNDDGTFRKATWDEALTLVADKFSAAVQEHGANSVAGVSCSRSINEDSYQMQKLFRTIFKTNNIDNCART